MQRIARSASVPSAAPALLNDIRRLIADARDHVASTANATLTMLYWQVGHRIRAEVHRDQRATYGERIVASVGRQLSAEYGAGFEEKNLRRMMRQLSWTHFLGLLPLKDPLQREFYAEMCRVQRWSVRALRAKIRGMLYESTVLPPKDVMQAKLQEAVVLSRARLERKADDSWRQARPASIPNTLCARPVRRGRVHLELPGPHLPDDCAG